MSEFNTAEAAVELFDAMDGLAKGLVDGFISQDFKATMGSYAPSIDIADLAANLRLLRKKYSGYDWKTVEAETAEKYLPDLKEKLLDATTRLLPYVMSSQHVPSELISLTYSIDVQLGSLIDPTVVAQLWMLPRTLRRDVTSLEARMKRATEGTEDVERMLREISAAYSVASELETTREDLEQAVAEASASRASIQRQESQAASSLEDIASKQSQVDALLADASSTMSRVHAAYRAATSEGLARSFTAKATGLSRSVHLWVGFLILALLSSVLIGWIRFPAILASIATGAMGSWQLFAAQIAVAGLSLAAPVWLAWVSTKQIGQRFRLAEDYAYKAALAAAYEGYRAEAARLDEAMEAQLFSIALTRLDEIPLRLVENTVAGSPIHELIRSAEFNKALAVVPGFRERFIATFKRGKTPVLKEPESDRPSVSE